MSGEWFEIPEGNVPSLIQKIKEIVNLANNGKLKNKKNIIEDTLIIETKKALENSNFKIRTQEAYINWVRRFLKFCGEKNVSEINVINFRLLKF